MRRRSSALLLGVIVALAGCGGQHSTHTKTRRSAGPSISFTPAGVVQTQATATTSTQAQNPANQDPHEPAPERGGTIPRGAEHRQDAVSRNALSATPEQALRRFAELYVNWDAKSVRAHQLALASISIGAARLTAEQVAAQVQGSSVIGQDSVSNSGEVISITRGIGGASGYWVVVTNEHTEGRRGYENLPARLHVTYALLRHLAGGWVISTWQPRD
ncbi:MAG TPA: hypothetical protein VID48_06065 [Solirubrobacteraceae bacterium]|jgi:hypothetical protein